MTNKLAVLLIFLFSLPACNYSDYSEELSGDYYYSNEGQNNKTILSHKADGRNIFSTVVDYAFNENFIIALQKPDRENHKILVACYLRNDTTKYPTNSMEEIVASEKVADSLLKNDSFYKKIFSNKENYWIISHKENKLYGPYKKEEFIMKRVELKIPESLKFGSK